MRWIAVGLLAAAVSVIPVRRAAAASLAAQLDDLLRRQGFQAVDTVVPTLVRTVARSADFPTAATGPDFVYEYRPETGTPERAIRPLSPVLVEAAQTVGRHVLQLGGSVLWSNFNRQDGGLLDNTVARFNFVSSDRQGHLVPLPGALTFDRFRIQDLVFSGFLTYGITGRWDVGLVVPGVLTTLQARGSSMVRVRGENIAVTLDRFDIDDSKLGVGDLLLRTKYLLDPILGVALAPALTLRLPTGNEDNFQGTGDTTITPGVTATRAWSRLGLYANAGFEFNAGDLERSAFRYGVALSVRMLERVSFVTELTGRSTVTDDSFTVPLRRTVVGEQEQVLRALTFEVPAAVPRSDIVSGSVGLKARLLPRCIAYVSVLFPLTKDGVTAPVTPIGGIELRF